MSATGTNRICLKPLVNANSVVRVRTTEQLSASVCRNNCILANCTTGILFQIGSRNKNGISRKNFCGGANRNGFCKVLSRLHEKVPVRQGRYLSHTCENFSQILGCTIYYTIRGQTYAGCPSCNRNLDLYLDRSCSSCCRCKSSLACSIRVEIEASIHLCTNY